MVVKKGAPVPQAVFQARRRSTAITRQRPEILDVTTPEEPLLNTNSNNPLSLSEQFKDPTKPRTSTPRYSFRRRSEIGQNESHLPGSIRCDENRDTRAFQLNPAQNQARPARQRSSIQRSSRINGHSGEQQAIKFELRSSLVHPFKIVLPSTQGPVPEDSSRIFFMSRPRAGRTGTGRDIRDGDMETDLLHRVVDAVKKAKEHNDNCQRLGTQIVELEAEIKAKGASTPEQHRKLDTLYREMMRNAEQEKRVHDDEDIVNNLAMIGVLKNTEEPSIRGGHTNKPPRKPKAPILESDVVVESPGPTPNDIRLDNIKRGKSTGQRSSSVASTGRSGTVMKEDAAESNRGLQAEKAGQLIIGAEVFYRFPKGSTDEFGVGIQCIIKKVHQDRKPIQYDVQDPEPDPSGKQNVHKAQAKDLIPIPAAGTSLPTFAVGTIVIARYPETDTFYKAKVRGIQKGEYTLRFEGEEDDKEQPVEKRFVLDSKMR